jgi:hypothetical protein
LIIGISLGTSYLLDHDSGKTNVLKANRFYGIALEEAKDDLLKAKCLYLTAETEWRLSQGIYTEFENNP